MSELLLRKFFVKHPFAEREYIRIIRTLADRDGYDPRGSTIEEIVDNIARQCERKIGDNPVRAGHECKKYIQNLIAQSILILADELGEKIEEMGARRESHH